MAKTTKQLNLEKKYHYTYEITYANNKRYIGVRSCICIPIDDVYYGSSKITPKNGNKIILRVFKTREEALQHEKYLQKYNDVVKNQIYYNQSIQYSDRFDVTGSIQSKTHRDKIGKANKGLKRTEEFKQQISAMKKGINLPARTKKFKDLMSKKYKGKPTKYPDKYNWINTNTNKVRHATCNEMAEEFCEGFSGNFTAIIRGRYESYHKWKLLK